MLLWRILFVIGRLYDVRVLVLVRVTQSLFPLTHFKRPNKSLLCYSAHVSFCSNQVTVILNELNRDSLNFVIPHFTATGRMPILFFHLRIYSRYKAQEFPCRAKQPDVLFSPKYLLSLGLMKKVTIHFCKKISSYVSPASLRKDKTFSRYTYKRPPHE